MSVVLKLRNPGQFPGILELALYEWENNPASLLEYQCKLLTCSKKVLLASQVSDTLPSTQAGVSVLHRPGTQAPPTHPDSPEQTRCPLFPAPYCPVMTFTESGQLRLQSLAIKMVALMWSVSIGADLCPLKTMTPYRSETVSFMSFVFTGKVNICQEFLLIAIM